MKKLTKLYIGVIGFVVAMFASIMIFVHGNNTSQATIVFFETTDIYGYPYPSETEGGMNFGEPASGSVYITLSDQGGEVCLMFGFDIEGSFEAYNDYLYLRDYNPGGMEYFAVGGVDYSYTHDLMYRDYYEIYSQIYELNGYYEFDTFAYCFGYNSTASEEGDAYPSVSEAPYYSSFSGGAYYFPIISIVFGGVACMYTIQFCDGCYVDVYIDFDIDTTGPTITVVNDNTTWTTANVTVDLVAYDPIGISAYTCSYEWDYTDWIDVSYYYQTEFDFSCTYSDTAKTESVGVKDTNGNVTYKDVNVYIDKDAPRWSVYNASYMSSLNAYILSTSKSIRVTLSDNYCIYNQSSATTYYKYGWTTSATGTPSTWKTSFYTNTATNITFNVSMPSTTTQYLVVYWFGKDCAGNVSTKPTGTYNSPSDYNSNIRFKVAADSSAPTLTLSSLSSGSVSGSGTSTVYTTTSGSSIVATFSDDVGFWGWQYNGYYAYQWCTNTYASSTTCTSPHYGPKGWINVYNYNGTHTENLMRGTIIVPHLTTTGVVYLWVKHYQDYAQNYVVTTTAIDNTQNSSPRVFKFNVTNKSGADLYEYVPKIVITPTNGSVTGSGSSSVYNVEVNGTVKVEFISKNIYALLTDSNAYSYIWCRNTSTKTAYYFSSCTRTGVDSQKIYDTEGEVGDMYSWGKITVPSDFTTGTYYLWLMVPSTGNSKYHYYSPTNVHGTTTEESARIFCYNFYVEGGPDVTPPVISSYTGGGTALYKSTTLSLTATDYGVGLHTTAYCFIETSSTTQPSSNSCIWQASKSLTVTGLKNSYYHSYARDANNNIAYGGYKEVNVDSVGPSITITDLSKGTIYDNGSYYSFYTAKNAVATIVFEDTNNLSSYNSNVYYRYKWCGSSATSTSSTCSALSYEGYSNSYVSVTNSGGERTEKKVTGLIPIPNIDAASIIYLWIEGDVRDAASNYSTSSQVYNTSADFSTTVARVFRFYVDNEAPSITPTTTTKWQSSYVMRDTSSYSSAVASDANSGLKVFERCIRKSGTTSYSCSNYEKTYANSSVLADGVNNLYYRVEDYSGNSYDTPILTLYVDGTKPVVKLTETFSVLYVDFINSLVNIPFEASDNIGSPTVTITNGGNYSSKKAVFPVTSINNKSLSFQYTIQDSAGNSISDSLTIDVSLTYDDSVKAVIKSAFQERLDLNRTLIPFNNGNQLGYIIDDDAATVIANLEPFGINPNSEIINLRYVFVSNELNADLTTYNNISRKTSLSVLQATLKTPLGQKEKPGKVVSLVLIFEDLYVCVGTGTIAPTGAVALASTFDTYTSAETTYQGAGLGEDGTVVSFSDDANSTMAVTLGASNMIEKRDVYGNLEWEKAITSSGKIELKKVINNEYGILVLGETTSGSVNGTNYPFKGGKDILVIRLDKQGNILFTNVIGTEGNDAVVSGDMNDNRIALLSSNEECTTMYTMNADGTNMNSNVIAGTGIYPSSIAIKNDRIVVIGSIHSEAMAVSEDDINNPKSSYVQLYENGSLVWTRTLGGSLDVSYYSLDLDNESIYVVGQSLGTTLYDNMGSTKIIDSFGGTDSMIVKYDYEGNIIQVSTIGGEGNDTFNQIIVTSNSVIVAGTSSSSDVSASHYLNSNFHINKLGEVDTLIVTLNKDLIIEEGLNLSYEEGMELQEIGINQYTEQLMILSSKGVHTQKVVDDTFKYEVVYEDGVLKIKANEKIASAIVYDGTNYYEIGDGIKLPYGAYEVKVTSITGQSYTQVVGFEKVVEHSILPMIGLFASILTLGVLVVLVIRKYRKEYISA